MTLDQEIEELLSKYQDKKLTKESKDKLKDEIHKLVDSWISDTIVGIMT